MSSLIRDAVLVTLNDIGEVSGIFHLGYRLIGTHDIAWLRTKLRELETEGQIEIVDNGNGKAKLIRKVNPNSPGYPRKVRR